MSRAPNRRTTPARAVGLATTAYGVAITASPRLLAAPVGLTEADGSVPAPVAGLTRATGTRDAALALALVLAPAPRMLGLLSAARVVSDATDAVWFGRLVSRTTADQRERRRRLLTVCGAALGWALLEGVVGRLATR